MTVVEQNSATEAGSGAVRVRPLREADLEEADRIFRLAFGTYLGLPDPAQFTGDADYVGSRFAADPSAALGAEIDGEVVGSNFITRWGSFSFFGPLSVRPDLWDRGIAKRLMEATMPLLEGAGHAGLFTWADSPKHAGLYQRYGFWPGHLTPIMAKPVAPVSAASVECYSGLDDAGRAAALGECRAVSGSLADGLDLEHEIRAAQELGLGETVLLREDGAVAGFAVCHLGAGSEAGTGVAFVKFGAVTGGEGGARRFESLLDACERLAGERGLAQLVAGVNTGRIEAYQAVLARGFRTQIQGVAMETERGNSYNRPGVYALDDWR